LVWEVILYETAAGRCPVCDYFDDLPANEADALLGDLELLWRFGIELGMPHVRHLRGRIYELRSRGPRMQHRVLYVAWASQQLVALHAFTKKTQKTPPRDIRLAESRLDDWESQQRR
jgi:phage-related protein